MRDTLAVTSSSSAWKGKFYECALPRQACTEIANCLTLQLRNRRIPPPESPIVIVGTVTIATKRHRRGSHRRIFISPRLGHAQTPQGQKEPRDHRAQTGRRRRSGGECTTSHRKPQRQERGSTTVASENTHAEVITRDDKMVWGAFKLATKSYLTSRNIVFFPFSLRNQRQKVFGWESMGCSKDGQRIACREVTGVEIQCRIIVY